MISYCSIEIPEEAIYLPRDEFVESQQLKAIQRDEIFNLNINSFKRITEKKYKEVNRQQ